MEILYHKTKGLAYSRVWVYQYLRCNKMSTHASLFLTNLIFTKQIHQFKKKRIHLSNL